MLLRLIAVFVCFLNDKTKFSCAHSYVERCGPSVWHVWSRLGAAAWRTDGESSEGVPETGNTRSVICARFLSLPLSLSLSTDFIAQDKVSDESERHEEDAENYEVQIQFGIFHVQFS